MAGVESKLRQNIAPVSDADSFFGPVASEVAVRTPSRSTLLRCGQMLREHAGKFVARDGFAQNGATHNRFAHTRDATSGRGLKPAKRRLANWMPRGHAPRRAPMGRKQPDGGRCHRLCGG